MMKLGRGMWVRRGWIVAMLCGVGWVGAQDDGMRALTSTDGKTVTARVLKVAGTDVVIQMEGGRTYTMPAAKFSPEDQLYFREWEERRLRDYVPKLNVVFGSGKTDAKDGTDYDNRTQMLRPSVRVENREIAFEVKGVEGVLLMFGKPVTERGEVLVLTKQTFPVSIPVAGKMEWKGNPVKVAYDANAAAQFGHKYSGYLVILKNAQGKVIHVAGTTGFVSKAEAALELREGEAADRDLRRLSVVR